MQGATKASWSTSSGTSVMRWSEAIMSLPKGKQEVVAGQIHDSQSDVVTIKLDKTRLFVDHGTSDGATLDEHYQLGTRFTVEFVVADNEIKTYFNGRLADRYPKSDTGLYFKVGAYAQSNCATEATHHPRCASSDYAEVDLYRVAVAHS